ncbi:lytic transglycosylase domain-containing protein [Salmonella enterica]|nr:lytic transglycosylase domain-containing protein [Salmonella enterica]EIJ5324841.1 lytic transglycosylase domain-containing protein [Salmonella enterica]EIQ4258445.1 lytic transglycosylase domain-containing protein [Salmonella enterica]
MIIQELAYKVTVKADEFLNGKRKVSEEVGKLNKELSRAEKEREKELKKQREELEKFGKSATSAFRNVTAAAAGFLGIGAGLYGIKQLFTSTANEIVRASTQAKFFGTDVNRLFGMRRGFEQAGLNADAFIGASGNARMALANIKDPTIFGGLTGAAQNLMVLGARTGLNINNLGDPNRALGEFTRYGKSHSQENLMQVMAAAGFDPTDAAKIKSGELKSLVDSETKKSQITAAQVKEQENLLVKMGELSSQVERVAQGIAMAFTPAVIEAMDSFGKWIESHQGDIIGFFENAGDKIKAFTDAVGGANALLILLAVGLRSNPLVMAAIAATTAANAVDKANADAKSEGKNLGDYMYDKVHGEKTPFVTWDDIKSFFGFDEPEQHAQSSKRKGSLPNRNNNPGNLRPAGASSGFRSFSSEQEGWDAMSRQLMMYFNGTSRAAGFKKLRTIRDIISKWAPPSENDTESYINDVSDFMKADPNQELNLADPNVMAKLRTAMAKREGFGNWKNGLSIGGANQFQNEYYLQQQKLANSRPPNNASSVDNSKTSSTHINTVVVNSNPQTVDALNKSIDQQVSRASTNAAFASGMNP